MITKKAKDIIGITDAPLSATDLVNIHNPHTPHFTKLHESGAENERYLEGTNFSSEQENDIYNQDRIPYPNSITADKLTRIISSQRNSKTSPKAKATKPEKEVTAELLNLRFHKSITDSDLDNVRNEIFTSGVAVKYGVGKIVKKYDKRGFLKIVLEERDYRDVIWDSNAKKYFKEDGIFMAERKPVYRKDIRMDYGDEIADSISVQQAHYGRDLENYWGIADKNGVRDNDIIFLFEHYQKVNRQLYCVVWNGEIVSKEGSRQEAEKTLRILKMPYLTTGEPLPKAEVVPHTEDGFDKYIFAHDVVLEYEMTELEDYPYIIYQAFHFQNKIWCMTDILKPKNKFMDKLLSQIDHAFGKDLKDAWEIVEPWLSSGQGIEQVIKDLKEGRPIFVNRPGAVKSVPPKGANPQWLQIYSVLKEDISEYSGGALFSGVQPGLQREAKETVAMKLRQQQLVTTLFIDNLRRWDKEVFRREMWWFDKYDNEEHVIKIHGGKLSPGMIQLLQENGMYQPSENEFGSGYVSLNKPGIQMSYLDTVDIDVEIVDESSSDAEKEAEFEKMSVAEQRNPDLKLSPTWTNKVLEKINSISYEERNKIQQEIQQAKVLQQQQMLAQQAMGIKNKQQAVN